jgi:hypothetical protein
VRYSGRPADSLEAGVQVARYQETCTHLPPYGDGCEMSNAVPIDPLASCAGGLAGRRAWAASLAQM